MNTKISKILLICFFSSLLITLGISPIRGMDLDGWGGFKLSALLGFIIYYGYSYHSFEKSNKQLKYELLILMSLLAGICVIRLPIHIMDDTTLVSIPEFIIHVTGIFFAFCCYKIANIKLVILYFA